MIVKKNAGTVVVGEGEFHGVLSSGIKERCGIVESEIDESPAFVHGLGIDNVSIHRPDGTRDEERVYRIVTDGIDVRKHGTAGSAAYLETRDFPAICGRRSSGDEGKQEDGEEHGQNGKENHSLGGHDHLPTVSADRRKDNCEDGPTVLSTGWPPYAERIKQRPIYSGKSSETQEEMIPR